MDIKELRIGNYIYSELIGDKTYVDVEFLSIHFQFVKCCGIPITEEWMSNFGFEKTSCDEMTFTSKNDCFYYRLFEGHIEWNGSKIFIKYIHQLQNLYFALTGEELKLTN